MVLLFLNNKISLNLQNIVSVSVNIFKESRYALITRMCYNLHILHEKA
ncbi:hypothetical protein DFN06_004138 [Clostridium beijerinckii]|nr:hypothetical protein [Clostridium beijerinckii]NYB95801.1 hypothetical protein [Clostridium beijerinckii]OOM20499.1 hypothetical protein CLBEI_43780 [Clostridium beijerinckii]SQB00943.1 Uncharacterised protein [Clostridium beijerinckii]